MSIRILLVDDEPISAQATHLMVKKTDPALEVAGVCYSGREAVRQAALLHPDIMIIDIQMPGLNGLDAMRWIRESNPNTSFIVISAYSEFKYAVEALSLGASDYLLKPVKQEGFSASLNKVVADTRARKEDMSLVLRRQEQLKIAQPMIRRDFFRALLPGAHTDEKLVACAGFLGLDERPGLVALFRRSGRQVARPLESLPEKLPGGIGCLLEPGLACGVFPLPLGASPAEYPAQLAALLAKELENRRREGDDIAAGVSLAAHTPLQYKAALKQALCALGEAGATAPPFRRCRVFDPASMTPPEESDSQATPREQALTTAEQIAGRAGRYIQENFHKELTLDEVASAVNLSPYYFSRLFKEHTGSNFSERLLQVRMEHAKQLLEKTDSSIKNVAFQVGYNDPNYFSRVFRKAIGVKASAYRALAGRGKGE